MLSILIPVYNIDCSKLVLSLQSQCRKTGIPFEILVYDDFSKAKYKEKNKGLAQLFGVSYVEMKENLGRAKIRNKLAKYSNHRNLLFIDADSKLPNKSYIKNYQDYLGKYPVIYGGRSYTKRKPTALKRILHWTYGTSREAVSAKKRNRAPHLHFMSNNFIIDRGIFEKIQFDPAHEGYGYEDTLIATELKKKNINIYHIDNPLIHTGIENTDVFFKKTQNALDNLIELYKRDKILETRLIRVYHFLKKWGLLSMVYQYIDKRKTKLEENLKSKNPKMRKLDLWKLHYFIENIESEPKPI
jgi:hypothetical protein